MVSISNKVGYCFSNAWLTDSWLSLYIDIFELCESLEAFPHEFTSSTKIITLERDIFHDFINFLLLLDIYSSNFSWKNLNSIALMFIARLDFKNKKWALVFKSFGEREHLRGKMESFTGCSFIIKKSIIKWLRKLNASVIHNTLFLLNANNMRSSSIKELLRKSFRVASWQKYYF